MNETEAQILFWGSMSCLPLGIGLLISVLAIKKKEIKRIFLFTGSVALSQFIWYFRSLGISLSDKIGNETYPNWWAYILFGTSIGLTLSLLTIKSTDRDRTPHH
jgi:hypothetical protein